MFEAMLTKAVRPKDVVWDSVIFDQYDTKQLPIHVPLVISEPTNSTLCARRIR